MRQKSASELAGALEVSGHRHFLAIGPAPEGQEVGEFDPRFEGGAGLVCDALGHGVGGIGRERAIEQAQGLRGDGGDGALRATGVRVRSVECLEERIAQVAAHEDVEASAVAIGEVLRDGPDGALAR